MALATRRLQLAQNHLKSLYRESSQHTKDGKRSWHYVAREMGLSVGTAIRVARDSYEPKAPHIRRILNLPVYVTLIACAKCGQVHRLLKKCGDRKSRNYAHIADMPVALLAWKMRNREEML